MSTIKSEIYARHTKLRPLQLCRPYLKHHRQRRPRAQQAPKAKHTRRRRPLAAHGISAKNICSRDSSSYRRRPRRPPFRRVQSVGIGVTSSMRPIWKNGRRFSEKAHRDARSELLRNKLVGVADKMLLRTAIRSTQAASTKRRHAR